MFIGQRACSLQQLKREGNPPRPYCVRHVVEISLQRCMQNYWPTRRWREATAQHEIIEHMRLL